MRETGYFWTGWIALALALVSPLHSLGEVLFFAHMVQHEILMLAAAPLLVLSRPLVPMLRGLPMTWRKSFGQSLKRDGVQCFWRAVTQPWLTWWVHAAVLWLWHIPALFEGTLTNEWVHAAQHLSFLGSALLFWWSLFYARGRSGFGSGMLYIFTTAVHTSLLGALLTLSPTPWYPAYSGTRIWGITPVQDQQLGGLIMWIPAGVVYLGAGLGLFAMWLRESEAIAGRSGYAQ
jgi:putative membrane protein